MTAALFRCGLVGTCLAALGVCMAAAGSGGDPVQELKTALGQDYTTTATPEFLQFRRATLQKLIDRLKSEAELRRALALTDWRDAAQGITDTPLTRIDAELRGVVAERFTKALEGASKNSDPNVRLATANLIAEIGPAVRAVGKDRASFTRSLTPLAQALAKDAHVGVRQEGLRALGTINPVPRDAATVLGERLKSDPEVGPRRVAAASLGQLVQVMRRLHPAGQIPTGVAADADEAVAALTAVAQTAAIGAADADEQVRLHCMEALRLAADGPMEMKLINEPLQKKKLPAPGRPLTAQEAKDIADHYRSVQGQVELLKPVLAAINAARPAFAHGVRDADPRVAAAAAEALQNAAEARQRLRALVFSLPEIPGQKPTPSDLLAGIDPLGDFLDKDLAALVPLFKSPDADVRRAAAYTLLYVEDRSLPLLGTLIDNLTDSDRTVRWAAAQTLSYLPPAKVVAAVPNLGGLLAEPDAQMRSTAADALQALGPLAREALPALVDAVKRGDTESRRDVLKAIEAQGITDPEIIKIALPSLLEVLQQPGAEHKTLMAVAETIGRMGARARNNEVIRVLRGLIGHDDADVRTAASEAILAISRAAP